MLETVGLSLLKLALYWVMVLLFLKYCEIRYGSKVVRNLLLDQLSSLTLNKKEDVQVKQGPYPLQIPLQFPVKLVENTRKRLRQYDKELVVDREEQEEDNGKHR